MYCITCALTLPMLHIFLHFSGSSLLSSTVILIFATPTVFCYVNPRFNAKHAPFFSLLFLWAFYSQSSLHVYYSLYLSSLLLTLLFSHDRALSRSTRKKMNSGCLLIFYSQIRKISRVQNQSNLYFSNFSKALSSQSFLPWTGWHN